MKKVLVIAEVAIIALNLCACDFGNSQEPLSSAQVSAPTPSADLPNTQKSAISAEPSMLPNSDLDIGKLFEIKEGWTKLSDISDEEIVNYPFLCTTENSGFHDIEHGVEFFADSMTGIQRILGITIEEDQEVSIHYMVDAIDMKLVLVRADGSVEHLPSEKDNETNVLLTEGENTFEVVGYDGAGSISLSINSDASIQKFVTLQDDTLEQLKDYIRILDDDSL